MAYVSYGDYIAQRPLQQNMVMKEDFVNKSTKSCPRYPKIQENFEIVSPQSPALAGVSSVPSPSLRSIPSSVPSLRSALSSVPSSNEGYQGSSDPKEWGPKYWYSLHNSAAHYPINASPLVRERMKARILAIPYEIACPTCQPHASAFIEANANRLDEIVSGREQLSRFYVEFHNKVNKRLGKPEWTYEQAMKQYSK